MGGWDLQVDRKGSGVLRKRKLIDIATHAYSKYGCWKTAKKNFDNSIIRKSPRETPT